MSEADVDLAQEGRPLEPPLSDHLAGLRRILQADSVQLVNFTPEPVLVEDCSPTEEIGRNLLGSVPRLPESAADARAVVSTYRFGGKLVYLIAARCSKSTWLLAWIRIPDGKGAEDYTAILEIAAWGIREKGPASHSDPLEKIEADQPEQERLMRFCQWVEKELKVAEVFLAAKRRFGWKVLTGSRQSPTGTSPLALAIKQLAKSSVVTKAADGTSQIPEPSVAEAAKAQLCHLTGHSQVDAVCLGTRYALVAVGESVTIPQSMETRASHALAFLDPPGFRVHSLPRRWLGNSRLSSLVWLFLLVGFVGIMLMPVSQRVRTEMVLEPETRRFIATPFNAVIETVHVSAGDIVEQGQLLVELDGREVNERLAEIQARLSMAILESTSELEAANYSKAAIRELDARSLAHERELLLHRQANLRIVSPIEGVVVTGEVERSKGAAVELGRPLLELAPLDVLLAEIAVDELDIALVHEGMEAKLQLHAIPGLVLHVEIKRIADSSETRDGRNIFVAEAVLDNHDGSLRPGMKGTAVIFAERRPLVWNLTRKPIQMLQRWFFR